jgi:hypothetical protein
MTKSCPNCGTELHSETLGCPTCGARWRADGSYAGVPDGAGTGAPSLTPGIVAEMTPGQLSAVVFVYSFLGALAAGGLLVFIALVIVRRWAL